MSPTPALRPLFTHTTFMVVFWRRSRYFRGKRFFGDFEIHVEQADIKDLTVTASAERGCTVSMAVLSPSGSRVVRSFRPDFFLCRQSVRDASKDYRNVLLGLNIGGVPSINSLHSLYNFQVRKPLPFFFFYKVIPTKSYLTYCCDSILFYFFFLYKNIIK